VGGDQSKSGRTGSTGSTDGREGARDRLVFVWDGGTTSVGLSEGEPVKVGRSRGATARVEHVSVSREHAVFTYAAGALTVTDKDSRNGTFVDGARIKPEIPTTLASEAVLRLGDVLVVHQPAKRTPPSASSVAPAWREVDRLLPLVARGNISVLVLGETGAGKEVTANALHRLSPRARGPFVSIHCAALPESLLEAELFGWERGAFTGATGSKVGLLESADGGTVFLDEITEIPPSTQAKLLRVVETKSVTRLGAVRVKSIDVRFVAATNRDIQAMVERGSFRDDLYYRLAGFVLQVPSLRARIGDIDALATKFVAEAARSLGRAPPEISRDAMGLLRTHRWPGNVRELRNAMECAVLLCQGDSIRGEHLPPDVRSLPAAAGPEGGRRRARSLHEEVEELERTRILEVLERTGGNQSRAARELGISRRLLLERLDTYGAPRPRKAAAAQRPGAKT
jgi:transcriptional regulator with PAS, ATPase and Fis domain